VRRHTNSAGTTISHLTGGLDSTSIAAAAHILTDRNQLKSAFHTVSAVFPGYANDESEAIREIAAGQPFPHRDFVPELETIGRFEADMWESDTPRPTLVDGLWTGTIEAARTVGGELVLSGTGGDEVLDQYPLAADLLRHGHLGRWTREVRSRAAWSDRHPIAVAADSLRAATPARLARPLRKALAVIAPTSPTLIAPSALRTLDTATVEANPPVTTYASATQNLMIWYARSPRFGSLLEYYEARYARSGLAVSYPYLDRRLIEHVASISINERPSSGGSKALIREGFTEWLPRSVLERRSKTVADDYLDAVISRQSPYFRDRYPDVSEAARPFIDVARYRSMMSESQAGQMTFRFGESLWKAWTTMAWLDGFDRYTKRETDDFRPY
jgi:asparagine synthetase B (glutamine-hydrolysing)